MRRACCPSHLVCRFSDARFGSMPISIRARRIRWAAFLDLTAFKEEVRGSNPLRATDPRLYCGFYAICLTVRPRLCTPIRAAVNGDGARGVHQVVLPSCTTPTSVRSSTSP
jgi:hypothetical protein